MHAYRQMDRHTYYSFSIDTHYIHICLKNRIRWWDTSLCYNWAELWNLSDDLSCCRTFLPCPQLGFLGVFATATDSSPNKLKQLELAFSAPLTLAIASLLLGAVEPLKQVGKDTFWWTTNFCRRVLSSLTSKKALSSHPSGLLEGFRMGLGRKNMLGFDSSLKMQWCVSEFTLDTIRWWHQRLAKTTQQDLATCCLS